MEERVYLFLEARWRRRAEEVQEEQNHAYLKAEEEEFLIEKARLKSKEEY